MNSINGRTTEVGMAACALTMLVLFILTAGAAVPLQAQTESGGSRTPTVTHNTWTSGTPIPTPVFYQAMGVLGGQIYVVGGGVTYTTYTADTQIYNPATNAWSTGTPLPTPTIAAAGAVVKNVLYVMGGYTTAATDAVWAYSTKTKTWTSKAPIPTALYGAAVVVEKNIIYLMGGQASDGTILNTVESYNPATNAWSTSEAPMLVAKTQFTAGLVGTTIVAPDGVTPPDNIIGDNEGYNATTNVWTSLKADPAARSGPCAGSFGPALYVAGGDESGSGTTKLTESFKKATWKTLAAMPQATLLPGSAVYKGQLYCFGGLDTYAGNVLNYVQIYQP